MPPQKKFGPQESYPVTQEDYDAIQRIAGEMGDKKSTLLRNVGSLVIFLYDASPTLTTRLLLAQDRETKAILLRQIADTIDKPAD